MKKYRLLDSMVWHTIGIMVTMVGLVTGSIVVSLVAGLIACKWADSKDKFVRRTNNERT